MPRKAQSTHDLRKAVESNGRDKWSDRIETERRGRVQWADCSAEDLLDAVAAVTEDGAALLLSTTSDGGALSIHVLTGHGTHKLYPATQAELNAALMMITEIAKAS
jgi:hypothetical protein